MRRAALLTLAVVVVTVVAIGLVTTARSGLSTHEEAPALEAALARTIRQWAVPTDLRDASNPLPASLETLAVARAHWADHCASCHGNDGRGQTTLGQRLYPRAPDMTAAPTQELSDGELFAIIENGIRLTGMPGWGDGTAESAHGSWALVYFIRHLPDLTADELRQMEALNPKSPGEWQALQEETEFLAGDDAGAPAAATPAAGAPHHH